MTTLRARWTWLAVAGALILGACGGSSPLGGHGGSGGGFGGFPTGGTIGAGGGRPSSTGGTYWATGGVTSDGFGGTSFGTGGVIGAGGSGWGTGGVPANLPDGGTCSAPDHGPISTSSPARPFGWTFAGPTATSAAPGGADASTGPARCQSVPAAYPGTSCVGSALLQPTPNGPAVVFADGARLQWNGALPSDLTPFIGDPTGGDTVWVDYERRNVVICPFCGAYTTDTLQIRDQQTGLVRFYDQQGVVLPNLTDAQVMDIFGVAATALQTCTFPVGLGCVSYLRSEFDHQLATSPPQLIVDATLSKVTTPHGQLAVFWASSQESYVVQNGDCATAPGVASDTGFIATLVAPYRGAPAP